MSIENDICEMLDAVGLWKHLDRVTDLTDRSLISRLNNNTKDDTHLIKAIEMRDRGQLYMRDGRVVRKRTYEDPDVVKINFPIGSIQIWQSRIEGFGSMTIEGKVVGYGWIQNEMLVDTMVFVVICQFTLDNCSKIECVHPNRFTQ